MRVRFLFFTGIFLFAIPYQSFAQIGVKIAFPNLSFVRPVDLQHPGDGTDRLFVVEQRGVISVFENDSSVTTSKVFLDIENLVNDSGNEEGLLGLAFHPDYEVNGYFYVDYTASNPRRTVIARYTVSATDPDAADENSEFVILEIEQPFSNHNGGQIRFGLDGYLYIGMGDGGSSGDPFGNGQNLKTLLGALLRIDVDTTVDGQNYGIPPDNPFVGNPFGYREEIYAYGIRNPWRFSFDPVTNWLWLADVGQSSSEEVDIIEIGKNYGWNIMEGFNCFSPPVGCDTTGLELPIWEYDPSLGRAIIGGSVYRGKDVPELIGHYIYADHISGRIWSLRYDGINPVENAELIDTSLSIASFGIDKNNELYICAFDGKIYTMSDITVDITVDPNPAMVGGPLDVLLDVANPGSAFNADFGLFVLTGGAVIPLVTGSGIAIPEGLNLVDFLIFSVGSLPPLPPVIAFIFVLFNTATGDLVAFDVAVVGITTAPTLSERAEIERNATTFVKQLTLSQMVQMKPVRLAGLAVPQIVVSPASPPVELVPTVTALNTAYPSAANPETWIPYQLAAPAAVVIEIYDAQGGLVRRLNLGQKAAGFYRRRNRAAYWNGTNDAGEPVASGLYFYQLRAGNYHATKKMFLVK